jgi:hypothetical protein
MEKVRVSKKGFLNLTERGLRKPYKSVYFLNPVNRRVCFLWLCYLIKLPRHKAVSGLLFIGKKYAKESYRCSKDKHP